MSATTGWAVGYGHILQTTDGGVTWALQDQDSEHRQLYAVVFLDATTGWAAGADGTILHTTDAGVDLEPTGVRHERGPHRAGLRESHERLGGRRHAGRPPHRRCGTTWVAQDSGTTTDLTDVDFGSDTEGWTAGEFLHTTTAGSLWTPQTSSVTRQDLSAVDFVDLLRGWAVGAVGTIVHTTDAGASWTLQASGTTEALDAVDFVDPWNGWAVGGTDPDWPSPGTRIILHTGDGGLTWETQLEASDYPLMTWSSWTPCRVGPSALARSCTRRTAARPGPSSTRGSPACQLRQRLGRLGRRRTRWPPAHHRRWRDLGEPENPASAESRDRLSASTTSTS